MAVHTLVDHGPARGFKELKAVRPFSQRQGAHSKLWRPGHPQRKLLHVFGFLFQNGSSESDAVTQLNELEETRENEGEMSLSPQRADESEKGLHKWVVRVADHMEPQGEAGNDHTKTQRVLNVLTSLPFLALGAYMMKKHTSVQGKMYAKSMIGVGFSALLYHATQGKMRSVARKLDYYSISLASGRMVRALWPESQAVKQIVRGSLLAIPFRPFIISTAYTLVMQAEFIRQGLQYEKLRPSLIGHAGTAAVGVCAFALEDIMINKGFLHTHSMWHCLSAYSVYTTSKLVQHKEQRSMKAMHDSVLSLTELEQSK